MSDKLTVLIPCKDEVRNIRQCIESVQSFADEILVADSGSVDGTQEIVRRLSNCRLIEREFVNYADFKNWAIPQAAHDWILIVDADERVTHELATDIKAVLSDPPESLDAYRVTFRSFFLGHELKYCSYNNAAVRLVRKDRCRYAPRRVHERMEVCPQRTGQLKGKMLHFSYWTYDEYFAKHVQYTRWGAEEMWDEGKRTSWLKLLLRPVFRFLHLYLIRRGCLDGLAGLQNCMLLAFFNTFVKQARLWEMERAKTADMITSAPSDLLKRPQVDGKAA